jgi:ribose-phosphate pyrophosphokinase
MKIFAGNANHELSSKIAERLGLPLGHATVDCFSDGESHIEVQENVRGEDVFVIQPTCSPANQTLMEMLVLIDALRWASAARITAVVPYFGYARQDRRVRSSRTPITSRLVAKMIADAGASRVLTVDLHSEQLQGFFDIPIDNLFAQGVLLDDIVRNYQDDPVVVSPDVGGVVRARALAKCFNDADLAIIDKRRPSKNTTEVMNIIGEVYQRDCILVDDMVDTAGTLCNGATALKKAGAATVAAYCTHPVLSGNAVTRLAGSCMDELVVTDTIPLGRAARIKKLRYVSVAGLLAEAMRQIHTDGSISTLH